MFDCFFTSYLSKKRRENHSLHNFEYLWRREDNMATVLDEELMININDATEYIINAEGKSIVSLNISKTGLSYTTDGQDLTITTADGKTITLKNIQNLLLRVFLHNLKDSIPKILRFLLFHTIQQKFFHLILFCFVRDCTYWIL